MHRLILALAVFGALAITAAPVMADDHRSDRSGRQGRYYDDHHFHRHGHVYLGGTWYRAEPYVTYYDPDYGSYYYDNSFRIVVTTPKVYWHWLNRWWWHRGHR